MTGSPVHDFCVIGGGIVGLSTALHLLERRPDASIVLVEKEQQVARHQTSHNSGVIHAGVYYPPDSLKARFCCEGVRRTIAFCREHALPFEQCGKLIVATDAEELPRLAALEERARGNGLTIERLDAPELRRREPHVRGLAALFVHETGITDYAAIARRMAEMLVEHGVELRLGLAVGGLREHEDHVTVDIGGTELRARHVVACAGLHADRLARKGGIDLDFRMIPFRGDYYALRPELDHLVSHLIYPVPDPGLPFLGVHLTRMIAGGITVGPNAALSLSREGYSRWRLDIADVTEMAAFPGFWKMMWEHRGSAAGELLSGFLKRRYLDRCRRYCPDLQLDDLRPYPSGVRAQPVLADGRQVHDFLIRQTPRTTHVCNAPSPAATASLPIGEHVAAVVCRANA